MNKEFIPYEQAVALKELGFDEPCVYYVNKQNASFIYNFQTHPNEFIEWCGGNIIKSPTFSQAFRWFREMYDWPYESWIEPFLSALPRRYKSMIWSRGEYIEVGIFNSREEAELECLKKLIKLVKK